jgi:hypothetical protein
MHIHTYTYIQTYIRTYIQVLVGFAEEAMSRRQECETLHEENRNLKDRNDMLETNRKLLTMQLESVMAGMCVCMHVLDTYVCVRMCVYMCVHTQTVCSCVL